MLILVFDTETTGLPNSKIISPDTLSLWPHIVQFSYVIYDTSACDIVKTVDKIVKVKEDVIITDESTQFHGITNQISKKKGKPIEGIFQEFFNDLKNIDMLVGHNISFDINIVKVELLRIIYSADSSSISEEDLKDFKHHLHLLTNFQNICCTLQETIELCDIKAVNKSGKTYLKFPKLSELHEKLFETTPNNLHNSFTDILVTLRCFMKLKYNIDLNDDCIKFKKHTKKLKIF